MVELKSAPNFRDLGGRPTQDGRWVRLGRVYRSGKLSALTPQDQAALEALAVGSAVDLRSADERLSEPSRWSRAPAYIQESPKPSMAPVMREMLARAIDGDGARAAMIDFYARIPTLFAEEYGALFARLVADDRPLLIHCTAGKDRTGVACAILLSVLDVPRPAIVEDYVLTQARLPPPRSGTEGAAPVGGEALGEAALARLPEEARRALWRADSAYLDAMFQALSERFGSATGYLSQALGLGAADVARLRASLTE